MNAHDAIVNAFLNAANASPALADGQVFEERLRAVQEGTAEAIVIRFEGSAPNRNAILGAPIDWRTVITVECHAFRDERSLTGRASRRLHGQMYARLMAAPTLGGVAFDLLEPDITTDQAQFSAESGCLIAQYPVLHRTVSGSLEAPA